jgi:predicted Zn finger-like uncharacterized protein
MKITCQACAAKYTIADEKVLGKVVKIRCKKCGATIVINGSDSAGAGADAPASQAGATFDYAGGGSAWMVNVAEGDQRTMEDHEVASAYRAGVLNDESFCWRDGMPDWLPLREIESLYAQCKAAPGAGPTDPPEDDATKIQAPPAFLLGSSPPGPAIAAQAAPQAAHAGGNGSGAQYAPAAPGPTARRSPGRAPAADLFGSVAQAGGEDDVMTSAPAGMPQAHEEAGKDKLTGARNENSVLFSLNALTSKGGVVPAQPLAPAAEQSGLIDIRQLSAQIGIGGDDKKKNRIDDIMNLAGGGAFSPSLSGPVLSAPPIEEYTPQASLGPAAPPPKGKKLIFLALGAGAFLVVAAVGAAFLMLHRGPEETADNKDKTSASASAGTTGEAPSASGAATDSVAKNDSPSPSATDSAGAGAQANGGASAPSTPTQTNTHAAAKESTKPSTPKESSGGVPAAIAAAAGPSTSDAPFNMGEAKSRLAAIAASAQSCKKGDLSGTGRVVVVFTPNGGTQSATITGPPFEGTSTGACVAAKFRGARVPPFGGSPFSVAKSFTIN